eukprot:3623520-Lingulodinium_polyedra.AAC.1
MARLTCLACGARRVSTDWSPDWCECVRDFENNYDLLGAVDMHMHLHEETEETVSETDTERTSWQWQRLWVALLSRKPGPEAEALEVTLQGMLEKITAARVAIDNVLKDEIK